jgi:hypothetical protein
MKTTYIASMLLFAIGVYFNDDVSIVISVLSLVILSCTTEILERVYQRNQSQANKITERVDELHK